MLRLGFKRLILPHQPLVYTSLAFIAGLIFAANFRLSFRVWFAIAFMWWLAATVCLIKRQAAAIALLFGGCFAAGGLLWTLNEANVGENRIRRMPPSDKLLRSFGLLL